jgi:hypothetical protein
LKKGKLFGVYLPLGIYELVEKTRQNLGMNRCRFIQYCLVRTLEDLNMLSEKAHE